MNLVTLFTEIKLPLRKELKTRKHSTFIKDCTKQVQAYVWPLIKIVYILILEIFSQTYCIHTHTPIQTQTQLEVES